MTIVRMFRYKHATAAWAHDVERTRVIEIETVLYLIYGSVSCLITTNVPTGYI